MKRPRYTRKDLLAQYDPNTPRAEEEQAWLDARPVGREFGAVRVLPLSRFRRDLNSIMRRGETIVVTRRGEGIVRLEPIATFEQIGEVICRGGASAGVPEHVEADPNVTDESLAGAIDKRDRERNIGAELLESVRAVKAEVLDAVHAPPGTFVLRCVDLTVSVTRGHLFRPPEACYG